MPPHWIRRKHDDMPTTNRHINYRRPVRKLIAACKHAADQQVLLIRNKPHDHARPQLRRHEEWTFPLLSLRIRTIRGIRRSRLRHCLNHIRIVNTTTPRRARTTAACDLAATASAPETTAASGYLEQRRLVQVQRQSRI